MPYAVAHVILTIVIADIYRDYFAKKKFPMVYVLIAGIAGLLPDADIPASWIFNFVFGTEYNFHRIYTHSLFYAIVFFLIAMAVSFFAKEKYKFLKWNMPKRAIVMFFLAISFGWFIHIALDCTISADGYLNWIPSFPLTFCPHPFSNDFRLGFDAIILILWLIHEQWKHDVKDYI